VAVVVVVEDREAGGGDVSAISLAAWAVIFTYAVKNISQIKQKIPCLKILKSIS
jgi:hypothetical protein